MVIAAVSDLHFDASRPERVSRLAAAARASLQSRADVLVVAGDLCATGPDSGQFEACLEPFAAFPGLKLMVCGNHDVWTEAGDSQALYADLPERAARYGFHCLDRGPERFRDVGFAGHMGWYDYTMRRDAPPGRWLVLRPGKRVIPWSAVATADFECKVMVFSEDGQRWEAALWNDRDLVRWPWSDTQFADMALAALSQQLDSLENRVARIVCVTHHLPFDAALPPVRSPGGAFRNAFMGSARLGRLLLERPRVRLSLFGHSHLRQHFREGHIEARNLDATLQVFEL